MTNVNSVSIDVVAAGTAYSGALVERYEYLSVSNLTGLEIFIRTDGSAATADGDYCTAIPPGGNPVVVANGLLLWDQASNVIPAGSNNQWGQWKGGGAANPGVSVSVIAVSGTGTLSSTPYVTIQGAG